LAKRTQPKVSDVVLVGRKPLMRYVTACITVFNQGNKTVIIKARGMAISLAVDVAEVVRRKFILSAKIRSIEIGTTTIPPDMDHPRPKNISTIEITLEK